MKITLITILIAGFIGVAVFGVLAMDFAMVGGEHGHDGCIASLAQGGNCPEWQSGLSLLIFHLDAFHGFSTAVFSDSFTTALILLSGLIPLAFFWFQGVVRQTASELATNCRRTRSAELSVFQTRSGFTHWLAFHENSPQFFVRRAV